MHYICGMKWNKIFFTLLIAGYIAIAEGVMVAQSVSTTEKPKLVVGIVVEQLRYDILERLYARLNGGIKTLMDEGLYYRNAQYDYSLSQSSPAFATIVTGADPAVHGIVSDEWYDLINDETMTATKDIQVYPVGGSYEAGFQSPINLLSSTFTDELKVSTRRAAKVYAVGLNSYSSILSAGHAADAAFWLDDVTGRWMSSSYYMDRLPQWVTDFNSQEYGKKILSDSWILSRPLSDYGECVADATQYEVGLNGQNSFPYDLKGKRKNIFSQLEYDFSVLKTIPQGNTLTTNFAIECIRSENLGQDDVTDFISITYSATDEIGRRFGPSSYEMADAIYRLDNTIAELLAFLTTYVGKSDVLVYFTAAHGIAEIPELSKEYGIPSGALVTTQAVQLLRTYLNALYGENNWVKSYSQKQIFLNRDVAERAGIDILVMREQVAAFMVQMRGINAAYSYSTLASAEFSTGGMGAKVSHGFSQQRSGDVLLVLEPGWIEKDIDFSTSSGSPYEYDIHVPLIWYGGGIEADRVNRVVNMKDIASTVSLKLNIAIPNTNNGEPLDELFR